MEFIAMFVFAELDLDPDGSTGISAQCAEDVKESKMAD